MENNFNWDKITQQVLEKYGDSLKEETFEGDVENIDNILNGMSDDLYEMMRQETVGEGIVLGFKNESNNQDPEYIYEGDSGFDLRANLTESVTLKPLERYMVPTGLSFEIPIGYEIQVRPRSGLAAKQGLSVLNSPGTVDQGYTGEVKVILVNLSNDTVTINHGERIAQAVLCPVITKRTATLKSLTQIHSTDRGDGGFGSTGK